MSISISDFKPKSEPPFGLAEDDFVQINDLIDEKIIVVGAKTFENREGPGVFLNFLYRPSDDKSWYTTTHSVNLVKIFGNEDLIALLESGETAEVTIIKRPSTKDAKKSVFDVE